MSIRASLASQLALAAALILGPVACSKKTVETPIAQTPESPRTTEESPESPTQITPGTSGIEFGDVFFDYDESRLRPDALTTLSNNGKLLLDDPRMSVVLEGHCDERGTVEYNLALGERRARAARSYLVDYGVESSRVTTISYGEERPFVLGHDESAWAQNRRVHFVPKGSSTSDISR